MPHVSCPSTGLATQLLRGEAQCLRIVGTIGVHRALFALTSISMTECCPRNAQHVSDTIRGDSPAARADA